MINRKKRHKKIRAKVIGSQDKPRFSVFRSNNHIYGQLIDDQKGQTLIAGSDHDLKGKKVIPQDKMTRKVAEAFVVGQQIAKKAMDKGIAKVVFDRGGYKYHGRIKAVAEGARQQGLKF